MGRDAFPTPLQGVRDGGPWGTGLALDASCLRLLIYQGTDAQGMKSTTAKKGNGDPPCLTASRKELGFPSCLGRWYPTLGAHRPGQTLLLLRELPTSQSSWLCSPSTEGCRGRGGSRSTTHDLSIILAVFRNMSLEPRLVLLLFCLGSLDNALGRAG